MCGDGFVKIEDHQVNCTQPPGNSQVLGFWNKRDSSKHPILLERQCDIKTGGSYGACITIISGLNCLWEIVLLTRREIRLRGELFPNISSLEKSGSWGLKRHSRKARQIPQQAYSLFPNLHREPAWALDAWPCEKLGGTVCSHSSQKGSNSSSLLLSKLPPGAPSKGHFPAHPQSLPFKWPDQMLKKSRIVVWLKARGELASFNAPVKKCEPLRTLPSVLKTEIQLSVACTQFKS